MNQQLISKYHDDSGSTKFEDEIIQKEAMEHLMIKQIQHAAAHG